MFEAPLGKLRKKIDNTRLYKRLVIKTSEEDKDASLNCNSLSGTGSCNSVIPSRSMPYPSILHRIQAMNG